MQPDASEAGAADARRYEKIKFTVIAQKSSTLASMPIRGFMMKIRTYILVGLVSWVASVVNAEDFIVPEGVTVLNEKQLMTQIIGNTYMLGKLTVEYFEPPAEGQREGRIKGKHRRRGLYGGNWKINGSLMCWEFDDPKLAVYNDCFTTALDGDIVTSYTIRGHLHTYPAGTVVLVPGNPNNL